MTDCKCDRCGDEHERVLSGFYIRYEGETTEEAIQAHRNNGFASVQDAVDEATEFCDGPYVVIDSYLREVTKGIG